MTCSRTLRALGALIAAVVALPACADAPRSSPLPAQRGSAVPAPEVAAVPLRDPSGGATQPAPAPAATQAPEAIRPGEGAALLARAGLSGRAGFIVMDAATGAVLEALAPDLPLAPASVAKAPTAVYALATLGGDFRFRTVIEAHGPVASGRLRGDLALVGGGDPELDSAAVARMAREAARVVGRVEGALRADAGRVIPLIDPDQQPQAAYNPAVAALNLNYNRVRLAWVRTGARLDHAMQAHAVGYSPAVTGVTLFPEPDDCGCPAYAHEHRRGREVWRIRQALLRGEGSVWLPVRAPEGYAAEVLAAALADAGVAVAPAAIPASVGASVVIARHESRPLRDMLTGMLDHSTNLTAEAVGRAATLARGGRADGLAASAAAMNAWAEETAGERGFALANHSGLSADSRVTPRAMAALLARTREPLFDLLPTHNIDERGARAPEGAVVRAKTGTMDFTRGLAGYAVAPSGRVLVFAIFANDLDRRAATRGHDGPPPGARAWRNGATALERALLRSWIGRFG